MKNVQFPILDWDKYKVGGVVNRMDGSNWDNAITITIIGKKKMSK